MAQSNKTCTLLQENLTAEKRNLLEKEETIESLQKEVEQLQSALKEQQQQLIALQLQADKTKELAKIRSLQQQLDRSQNNVDNLTAKISTSEHSLQDQKLLKQEKEDHPAFVNIYSSSHDSFMTEDTELQTMAYREDTLQEACPDSQKAMKILLSTQDECEALKKEICETLKCLDEERSKFHKMKQKHKAKLCRAKQKFEYETAWRDEKIKCLQRELSLCSHSLAKEKELVISITVENEKLLSKRRKLLQQLNEEEHNKKDSNLKASLSKCRVEFLEMENKKLGSQIFQMSNQLAVLERSLQNTQLLHFAEKLKKMPHHQKIYTSLPQQSLSMSSPERSEARGLLDGICGSHSKQTDVTSSSHSCGSEPLCRSAEMGYLNLTSTQKHHLDHPAPLAALSSFESPHS